MTAGLKIGKCIYCGTTEQPLYREHIIPFGLEADATLLEASCPKCARATGSLEGYIQGNLLGPFRRAANFRSRKKKKKPSVLPLTVFESEDDQEGAPVNLPPHEYPMALNLPVFPPARVLRGIGPDNYGETIDGGGFWHWIDNERVAKLAARGITTFSTGRADPYAFARFMAKIAHAETVAQFGVDNFTPLTIDLIMGREGAMNYWVGCGGFDYPPNPQQMLHAGGRIDHYGLSKSFSYSPPWERPSTTWSAACAPVVT